jgi:hypothetical protein
METLKTTACDGEKAFDLICAAHARNEFLVILGDAEELERVKETMELNEDTAQEILEHAKEVEISEWLEERESEDYPSGEWPDEVPGNDALTSCTDILTGEPKQVFLATIPVANSWEIPAYLKFGGWNDCPAAEEHVAIMKYWHEKYGATIVALTGDVIECTVERPPQTREEALALAKEMYVYCYDIVDQGVETIENLAASLLKSKLWFFWWD